MPDQIVNRRSKREQSKFTCFAEQQGGKARKGLTLKSEFPQGEPNVRFAQYFQGNSYLAPLKPKNLSEEENTVQGYSNVTFEPGDIIDIPEGVKHWHGAQKDSWFQHIATHVATNGEEYNEWLEAVSVEQ